MACSSPCAAVAQLVRAPVCGTGGRWFETTQLYHPLHYPHANHRPFQPEVAPRSTQSLFVGARLNHPSPPWYRGPTQTAPADPEDRAKGAPRGAAGEAMMPSKHSERLLDEHEVVAGNGLLH